MCDTCGCNNGHDEFKIIHANDNKSADPHSHSEDHAHEHHSAESSAGRSNIIHLETDILSKNNLLAERNRGYFEARNIKVFNLVSSPGSGKTTLLEKLIGKLKSGKKIYVIEGDQQTTLDADRIEAAGAKSVQINTGNVCHLDAHMINHAVKELNPDDNSLLFIENVGNLVCPALFKLGENARIIIVSVTEGEDKPLKYPNIFNGSQLCVLNKTDLVPYLEFDRKLFYTNLKKINPGLQLAETSAKTGEGIEKIIDFILSEQ